MKQLLHNCNIVLGTFISGTYLAAQGKRCTNATHDNNYYSNF